MHGVCGISLTDTLIVLPVCSTLCVLPGASCSDSSPLCVCVCVIPGVSCSDAGEECIQCSVLFCQKPTQEVSETAVTWKQLVQLSQPVCALHEYLTSFALTKSAVAHMPATLDTVYCAQALIIADS